MNADEFREVWRVQTSQTRLTIEPELLLREVQRNQHAFASTVFWRDVREVGVSLVMIPVSVYLAAKSPSNWPWYLMAAAMVWVAAFMVTDRVRQNRRAPEPGEPIARHVESSLRQVEHQIWLLRNVLWWYLLPPGMVMLVMYGASLWGLRGGGWKLALQTSGAFAAVLLVLVGVYWLNRYAVRAGLEPRRRELQDLLASLQAGQ